MSLKDGTPLREAVGLVAGARAAARVAAAELDPVAYRRAHRKMLESRGVRAGSELLRRDLLEIALLDGLLYGRRSVECDWRELPEEVLRLFISILPAPKNRWRIAIAAEDTAPEVARAVAAAVEQRGDVVLRRYPVLNDSFYYVLLQRKNVAPVNRRLAAAGLHSLVEDLGEMKVKAARKPTKRPRAARTGTWKGFLDELSCSSTRWVLDRALRDPVAMGKLREQLAIVPAKDREVVQAFLQLVRPEKGKPAGNVVAQAEALEALAKVEVYHPAVARRLPSLVRQGAKEGSSALRPALLRVISFWGAPDIGRRLVGLMSPPDQALVRQYAVESLDTTRKADLSAAFGALMSVGRKEDVLLITRFVGGRDALLSDLATRAVTYLRMLKE